MWIFINTKLGAVVDALKGMLRIVNYLDTFEKEDIQQTCFVKSQVTDVLKVIGL